VEERPELLIGHMSKRRNHMFIPNEVIDTIGCPKGGKTPEGLIYPPIPAGYRLRGNKERVKVGDLCYHQSYRRWEIAVALLGFWVGDFSPGKWAIITQELSETVVQSIARRVCLLANEILETCDKGDLRDIPMADVRHSADGLFTVANRLRCRAAQAKYGVA
jgi:hypothetical protein